jgi:drug/metabolite transporter (DMT)-like permease
MKPFVVGNICLVLSILSTAAGQVVIKALSTGLPAGIPPAETCRLLLLTDRVWRAGLAALLVVAGFAFWILGLHRLPLSYAYPLACSSALVVTLLSVVFLGEHVGWRLWTGTLLIALGAALVVGQQ